MDFAKIKRVPLTISAYASGVATLRWTPPAYARCAVVGVIVDTLAALRDHQVTGMTHRKYDAITTSIDADNGVFGAPLGHVANFLEAFDGLTYIPFQKFQLWPGKSGSALEACMRLVAGAPLSQREMAQLEMARLLPSMDGQALWPLQGTHQFEITVKRLFGSTAITRADLLVVELPEDIHAGLLGDGTDLAGLPHWLTKKVDLAATLGTVSRVERKWNTYPLFDLALQAWFASTYSDNSGTILQAVEYADDLLVEHFDWESQRMGPEYTHDARQPLGDMAPAFLQQFRREFAPGYVIPSEGGLRPEFEVGTATALASDTLMSYFGVLVPSRNKMAHKRAA